MFEVIASSQQVVNAQVTSSLHEAISSLLDLVVIAVSGGAAWLIKLGISKLRFEWQKGIANRVVSYAEMKLVGSQEKREYAAKRIHEKFPRLSEDEINHLLEEAVLNLQKGLETPKVVIEGKPI